MRGTLWLLPSGSFTKVFLTFHHFSRSEYCLDIFGRPAHPACWSGLKKLRAVHLHKQGFESTYLWRGLKNTTVSEEFRINGGKSHKSYPYALTQVDQEIDLLFKSVFQARKLSKFLIVSE